MSLVLLLKQDGVCGANAPFDEWGLCLVDLEGSRENHVTMVPLLVTGAKLAPRVDAGGQAPPGAGGAGAEGSEAPAVPQASSSGARNSHAKVAVEGATQPAAPEAEAPEASGGHREAELDGSPQLGAPVVTSSGAPLAAPFAGLLGQLCGRPRVDSDALRKRKGSPSCGSGAFRPLKQRKYIAIDE